MPPEGSNIKGSPEVSGVGLDKHSATDADVNLLNGMQSDSTAETNDWKILWPECCSEYERSDSPVVKRRKVIPVLNMFKSLCRIAHNLSFL